MKNFIPISDHLFFKSTKENDPRLGEAASHKSCSVEKNSYVINGYPDDEGIALNQGRIGAAKAPDKIREYFYKMSSSFGYSTPKIYDNGNINNSLSLQEKHSVPISLIKDTLNQGAHWISFGGGHDFAFPDGSGFIEYCKENKLKPLILNFDAHLDVRSTSQGLSSGTPFYRLLNTYDDIKLLEIGIQSQCNSQAHFEWCKDKNVSILTYDEIIDSGEDQFKKIVDFITPFINSDTVIYLSIDIDGFAACHAMGCSQSWATGFEPNSFLRIIGQLKKLSPIPIMGIYEVSPPLDYDNRTSKLAAQIVHKYLF